jgi:hypothetical protein
MDFSLAAAALMASSGRATSISFSPMRHRLEAMMLEEVGGSPPNPVSLRSVVVVRLLA